MATEKRAEFESHPDQMDLEEVTPREILHIFEASVQSQMLDEHGRERPNPTPMAPPVGYKRQPTIAEQMRRAIQQASYEAKMAGAETEQEANDFDVGEDMEPHTPYEHDFEMDPVYEAMLAPRSRHPTPGGPTTATPPASPPAKPEATSEAKS